jgi:biopolymer transport protein ExbD
MSRRRSASTEEAVELNLSPMIDVIFLLLIFFVVIASRASSHSLDIQLPSAQAGKSSTVHSLKIELNREGQLWVDGEICSTSSLIAIIHSSSPEHILIYADQEVSSGKLIALISQSKAAGVEDVRVATQTAP